MNTVKLRFNLLLILGYPLLLLFSVYIIHENPMNEVVRGILYMFIFFMYIVFSFALYKRIVDDTYKLRQKEENIAGLELFVEHIMRTSELNNFVKDIVDIHWKNRRSIDSYGEFFFRLIGQNGKVSELFVEEIRRVTDEQKEIFEKSEKSHLDFNEFSRTLSSLNELLQKITKIKGSSWVVESVPIPAVVLGTEPRVPFVGGTCM